MSSVLDSESLAPSAGDHGVVIEALSCGGWRLCDAATRGDDADHVIAYVEGDAGGFDVTWVLGGCGRQFFAEWSDVVDSAARRVVVCRTRGGRRPVEIAHFPPPR